jgi:D-alanyl-D-alanine carboxypeptidase
MTITLRLLVPMSLLGGSIAAQQPPAGVVATRPSPISQAELVRRLSTSVDSLAKTGEFSGVTVLARNSAPVFERAYGLADRERGIVNNLQTAFNLGSINKAFTQIAILQLSAAGKLDLDSTLRAYWPDYPNKAVAQKITIRQLIRHTSGIGGDIFDAPTGGTRHDVRTLNDYLALFVNEPLQFEPGTTNAYSNAGYVVLGLLIERLSGQDYYTYVREHILEPAGMTHTGSYFVDSLPLNTAIGYTSGEENAPPGAALHPNTQELPGRGSSAGGGYSTAQDLLKFLQALREHRIPNGLPAGLGIAGGSGGINGVVDGALPGGYDLIVLANLDPPAAMRVARMVRGWLGVHEGGGPGPPGPRR